MKNYILILFCCLISNILIAQEQPKVLATASMIQDMAQNIVGDLYEVGLIVPIGGDPHIYEPTPSDAKMVSKSDLIFKNGLTFEGWLNELIENSGTKADVVTVTDGINPITSDKYANSVDPHCWMDAKLGLKYIENIKNGLIKLDPKNKLNYTKNFEAYHQKLVVTDQYIKTQLNKIPKEQRVLITSHDAFQYFGRKYDIQLEAVMGTSTDAEVQTSDIIRLGNVIKNQKVPALFVESTINPKLLEQLAKDHKISIGGELFADSLGDEKSPADTYINMLRHNADTILEGLKRNKSNNSTANHNDHHESKGNSSSNYILYGILAVLFIGGFFVAMKTIKK